jgi:hypothetical protein
MCRIGHPLLLSAGQNMSNDSPPIFVKMSGGKNRRKLGRTSASSLKGLQQWRLGNTAMKFPALLAVSGRVRK